MHRAITTALILALGAGTAWAGSFSVSPVRLHLSQARATTAVNITNTGAKATVVQAVLREWTQQDGKDVYTPTGDLLATPPIFDLSPRDTQVVRVGLLVPPAASQETAYRLFLTEVPPAPRPHFVGLQVALRVSIPIFVAPLAGQAVPKLVWRLQPSAHGGFELDVRNEGNAHARVTDLSLAASAHGPALARLGGGNGYVLPHAEHVWKLASSVTITQGQELFVRGKTAQGERFQTQLSWAQ